MDTIDALVERQRMEVHNLLQRQREVERALVQITQKVEVASARFEALAEAQQLIAEEEARLSHREAEVVQPRRRSRRLTKQWRQILRQLSDQPNFSYRDIEQVAKFHGYEVTRDTMRSQMSIYKASGLVEAIDDGVFRVTDQGRSAGGLSDGASEDEEGEEEDANFSS